MSNRFLYQKKGGRYSHGHFVRTSLHPANNWFGVKANDLEKYRIKERQKLGHRYLALEQTENNAYSLPWVYQSEQYEKRQKGA